MSHTAIVPVKDLSRAKSRLHDDRAVRRDLAQAFATDIINLLVTHPLIARTVVVTGDRDVAEIARRCGAEVVDESSEPSPDPLNRAIGQGLEFASSHWPADPAIVVFSDLVLLDTAGLTQVLDAAEPYEVAFVRDADGSGTTFVVAKRPGGITTRYGSESAERHRAAGFNELTGLPMNVRRDVDDLKVLDEIELVDQAPHTAAVLARLSVQDETRH